MRARTLISTPYPSAEEVASELGLSAARVRELHKLMNGIIGPAPKLKVVHRRSAAAAVHGRSAASAKKKKRPSAPNRGR